MGSTAGNFTESEHSCGTVVTKRQKGRCIHLLCYKTCCSCVDSFLIIFLPPFRVLLRISLLHSAFERKLKWWWPYFAFCGRMPLERVSNLSLDNISLHYILQCVRKCCDENSYYALNFGKKLGVIPCEQRAPEFFR